VLLARYGSGLTDRLTSMFAEAGLPFSPDIDRVPNSRRAQALAELARDRGLHRELHPRLFDAYWARGLDLGDDEVLVGEGRAVGLEEDEVRAALQDQALVDRIAEQTSAALELGAAGVPAWLIDERALVPGAQPHEVFERVLERLGHQPIAA
jgi:predicted DsbA family dithiol-disulfide isomerase